MSAQRRGRAPVNAQRLLEPLQMCRKRFGPGRKAFIALPRLEFRGSLYQRRAVSRVSARGLRDCAGKTYALSPSSSSESFRMIYITPRIEIKIHRLLALPREDSRYPPSRVSLRASDTRQTATLKTSLFYHSLSLLSFARSFLLRILALFVFLSREKNRAPTSRKTKCNPRKFGMHYLGQLYFLRNPTRLSPASFIFRLPASTCRYVVYTEVCAW